MSIVFPGQALGSAEHYSPGVGTHLSNAQVCASLLGTVHHGESADPQRPQELPKAQTSNKATVPQKTTLSIARSTAPSALFSSSEKNVLPAVDSTVLARVIRINPRQANLEILVVGDVVCADGFQGLVRVQDVRATEKDKVKIAESFRPGDIVRAVVISLGDQSNYYLSTATNLLGVVMATSNAGNAMFPVSWKEFRDPVTGATENRKVAKPF